MWVCKLLALWSIYLRVFGGGRRVCVYLRGFHFLHPFFFFPQLQFVTLLECWLSIGCYFVVLVQDSKSIQETELLTFKSNLIENEYSECTRCIEIGCIKSNTQTKKVWFWDLVLFHQLHSTSLPVAAWSFLYQGATVVKGYSNDFYALRV